MFKNDERYWDINLLNKWFAVSSIIFLVVTVWVFVDDNDDEFKTYQKEFRKMQVELAEKKLIQDSTLIAADKVLYEKELALVGSRDRTGKIRFFPIVETFQSNHVCDWVLAPGTNEYDLNLFAINIFSSIVNELNYVGVLAIEFFYGDNGLLINEIAPRTHNSAHFSIEACTSSQFDQYVCISSGIMPPEIKMNCEGAIMINLLGLKKNFSISMETRIKMLSEIEGSNIHCYGKSREILGRKMAHITFLLNGKTHSERYDEAQILLTMVRDIWPSPNA